MQLQAREYSLRIGSTETGHSEFAQTGQQSTDSDAETESEFESEGETEVPVWVPIPVQELGHESEWSREEKLSMIAEMLKCQQQRHCFIKLDTKKVQPMLVPFVRPYLFSEDFLLEYGAQVSRNTGAISAAEADRLIEEGHTRFLKEAFDYVQNGGKEEDEGPDDIPFE